MTKISLIGLCLAGLATSLGVKADAAKICYAVPPGIVGGRLDVQDQVVLQKVNLGPNRQVGFIATEYLGSPNLQASVYLKKAEGYCLVGDFDGVTEVKVDKRRKVEALFDIKTESISGSDRFFRVYRYAGQRYNLIDCYIKNESGLRRRCADLEK
jgi:hypothetical protein